MAKGPDLVALASSLATVAIASLGGPVAAGGAALGEIVRHTEAAYRTNAQAKRAQQHVADAITSWGLAENLADVGLGLDLAARVVSEYGVSKKECAELRYDAKLAAELVIARAAEGSFRELITLGREDRVVVARNAIGQTYTALFRLMLEDEKLLPGVVVLLEESHRLSQSQRDMNRRLDRLIDSFASSRSAYREGSVNRRAVIDKPPSIQSVDAPGGPVDGLVMRQTEIRGDRRIITEFYDRDLALRWRSASAKEMP